MKKLIILFIISCFILPFSAWAGKELCSATINNTSKQIEFDTDSDEYLENTTFREIFFSGYDGSCPGFIVLKHMTPTLSSKEREMFCAEYDKKNKVYLGFSQGVRDAYGKCKKTGKICKAVNSSKNEALAIVGLGTMATGGATGGAAILGITAVTHSSGAVILTGSAGYLAGTLGTAAAGVVAALTAPAAIIATTVSVVAVGSAVYLCKPPN